MIELGNDEFDTHRYLSSLKKMKDENFNQMFEEYHQKYHLD